MSGRATRAGASLGRSLEDARVLQSKTEGPLGFPENAGRAGKVGVGGQNEGVTCVWMIFSMETEAMPDILLASVTFLLRH